jgi:hypothetical protein
VVLIAAAGVSRADGQSTFRVVLLPDTQYYSVQPPENNRYSAQTQWIKDNAAADNTQFVIHLGDLVEGGITTPSEWEYIESEWQIADAAHDILEAGPNPVPYSVLPGNHDFNDNVNPPVYRDTYWYNQWFGPDRFAGKSWYGGYRDARGDRNDNNYCYFTGAGMDFMVLNMEFFPTAGMVDWADGVIKAHPNHRVIVATHWYLDKNGSRHTAHSHGGLTDGRSGQDIWNELIKDNDNVFMVVCGHEPGEQWRQVTNSSGKPVFELLSDYQMVGGRPPSGAGGDGWLTTLDFDAENDTIKVRSYSPTRDQYDLWSGTKTFAYDMVSTPPPPPPPATLRAYWSFDQDGADLVGDSDMTLQAQATIALGNFGNGLHVTDNPAHGYASAAADPDLDVSSHFSAAMWMKYDGANDAYARVIARKQDDDNGYNIAFWEGDDPTSRLAVRIMFEGDDYIVSTTDALVERDEFHHIAFTFNDDAGSLATNKIVLWIDGLIVATKNISTTAGLQGVTDLVLGRGTADMADFAGVLDEVRFYSGVLSQLEITALQSAPLPGDANWDGVVDDADASILAAHWQVTSGATWMDGDFNGDGTVDAEDASILAAHWQESIEDTSPVPEPCSLVLLGSFAAAIGVLVSLLAWRRRGR